MTANRFPNRFGELRQILGLCCNSPTLGVVPRGDQYARFCVTFDLKGQGIHWNSAWQLAQRNQSEKKSINSQLPVRRSRSEGGSAIPPLLRHFFELRTEQIYTSIGIKITAEGDVKRVSLLGFRYSFTTSICLSITCPVNLSIATCTQ
jgi:hypothetical protein